MYNSILEDLNQFSDSLNSLNIIYKIPDSISYSAIISDNEDFLIEVGESIDPGLVKQYRDTYLK